MVKIRNAVGLIIALTLVTVLGCASGSTGMGRRDVVSNEKKGAAKNVKQEAVHPDGASESSSGRTRRREKQTDVQGQLDDIPAVSKLTVRGARFTLKHGLPVVRLSVYVDNRLIEECDLEYLEGDVCVDEQAIEPGTHNVMIWILARDPETLSTFYCPTPDGDMKSCDFYLPITLNAGLGEHLVIDAGQVEETENPADYLARTGGYEPPADPCLARLLKHAIAPSCSSGDLAAALSLAADAREVCVDGALDSREAMALIMYAEENHFRPDINRCYNRIALKEKIPRAYFGYSGDAFWPPRTIKNNTWDWARNTLPEDNGDAKLTGVQYLDGHTAALEKALKRLSMVEGLFDAFMDDAKADHVLNQAVRAKWSLDPLTVEGHRNFVIVRSRMHKDGETAAGKAYLEYAAKGATADESLHCSIPNLSGDFVFMLMGDGLSRSDYMAVQAMIQRTPPSKRLGICGHAFSPRKEGAVPIEERMRWLAQYDCSTDNRHKALLGDELRSVVNILEDDGTNDALANALRKQYADCLER